MPKAIQEKARYAVVSCPYEATTAYLKGTKEGPDAILCASLNIEPYDYKLRVNPAKQGVATYRCPYEAADQESSIEDNDSYIKSAVAAVLPNLKGKKAVFLGGEHTISYYSALPFLKDADALVVFDAHADAYDVYNGERLAHATWLRRLREKRKIDTYLIGIRSVSEDEAAYISAEGIRVDELPKGKRIYLSIDVDVLELAAMPCTSNPEPFGLTWRELYGRLEELFSSNTVIAGDVVEHKPCKDLPQFSYATALLVYKLFAFWEFFKESRKK